MPQTVDTSIYSNLTAPKPPDVLGMASSVAGTVNALNQNKLFGQTFGARQAIGQAYQQSIGPDGQLDTNKLLSNVANDPRAAFMAGDVAQQALERQKAQLGIKTEQLNLGITHAKAMGGAFAEILANPNPSMKDVTSAASELVAQGLISPQEAATNLSSAPTDPAGIRQWAQSHFVRYMGLQGQLEQALPKPTIISNGQQQIVADTNPLTNPGIVGAQVPNKLAPSDLASPVTVFDPVTKQNKTITKAQFLQQTGGGGLPPQMGAPGAPQAQPQPSQAPQPSPLGTGRMPAQAPGAVTPPQGNLAPQPQAAASPGLASGPPLGAAEAASVTAHQSAQQGVDLQKAADTVPQQKALLGNLDTALDQFTSGPGADWKKVATALANTALPEGLQIHPQAIASQEEFNKQALQLAQQQFQTLGGTGTDAKLDSTMHTSPNEALSKLGNKGIIQLLKGNADAIAVKNQEWQNWLAQGHGSETYGKFSTAFNKSFDPRVFQSQYMTPEQKTDMLKGLDGVSVKDGKIITKPNTEGAKFRNAYNYAVSQGWIGQNAAGQ